MIRDTLEEACVVPLQIVYTSSTVMLCMATMLEVNKAEEVMMKLGYLRYVDTVFVGGEWHIRYTSAS